MFTIFIIILILLITFFHYLQGLFSAIISAVLAFIAAMIAVSYHEPIVEALLKGKIATTAHGIVLLAVFALVYLVGRVLFDNMVPGNVRVPAIVDKVGGAAMGLCAAIFTAGVVAISAQEMPFYPAIWGYSRYELDNGEDVTIPARNKNVERPMIDAVAFDTYEDAKRDSRVSYLIPPVDDIVLGNVKRMSEGGSMAGSQTLGRVHPDWLTELFGQRGGMQPGVERVAINTSDGKRTDVTVKGIFTLEAPDPKLPEAGKTKLREAEYPAIRSRQTAGPFNKPKYKFFVIRVFFGKDAADKDGYVRFSPGSIRLVTHGIADDKPGWVNYFPVGTLDEGYIFWRSRPDDFLFVNDNAPPEGKDKGVDLIYYLDPATGFLEGKAGTKVSEGTFLEVKRLARVDLSGMAVKGEVTPEPDGTINVLRKPNVAPPKAPGTATAGQPPTPAAGTPAAGTPAAVGPASPLAQKLVGAWETQLATPPGTLTITFSDAQMDMDERHVLGPGNFFRGAWKSTGSSGNTLNVHADLKDAKGKAAARDIVINFDGDDSITMAIPGLPNQTLKRKNPGSAAVTAPPVPAPKPEDTFTLDVTDARVYKKFYTTVGLPKDAANGASVPTAGNTGTATLDAGKISVLDLKPVDPAVLRASPNQVSELSAPDGTVIVQVQADPSTAPTADPWAWQPKAGSLVLVDGTGAKHPVVGAWVAVEDAGVTKIAGRFDAVNKKVSLADMKIAGKPSKITFVFFVPTGTQVKEVRMGETLLKSVDLTAQ